MKISHNNQRLKPLNQDDFEMKIIEDLGTDYLTLTSKSKARLAIFQCNQCYRKPRIIVHHAKKNQTSVCPFCANSNANKIHGKSKHKLANRHRHMMDRCYNDKSPRYMDYGARGVRVSSEFINIENYINYVEGLKNAYVGNRTVDRINNDKNYERGNSRWATLETQARNTRKICKSNTSGYRGVSWSKSYKKWIAQITVSRNWIVIGIFKYKEDAAKAYDKYIIDNNLEHTKNF